MTDSIEENYPGLLEGEVNENELKEGETYYNCLLYTSPSPRD